MKIYLPIGSIVLLRNGTKKVMIYGRRQMQKDNGQMWDYIACLYPEGNINEEYMFLFNHEDIAEVIYRGYSNVEEEEFLRILNHV